MSDTFQTIQSGQGLLKTNYDDNSPVSRELNKRLEKIKEKTLIPTKDEVEQNDGQG